MKKAYAIIAQKGGTGKTTTAVALAAGLVNRKQKVLLIDADTQGNATFASNVDMEPGEIALSGIMEKKKKLEDVVCGTEAGYDLIPFDKNMPFYGGTSSIKVSLAAIIEKVSNIYDYVIIDCPPNIGAMTVQALEAVDEIVIPCKADAFSLDALKEIALSVRDARKKNRKLMIAGVLLNRVNPISNIAKVAVPDIKELSEMIGTRVFNTKIPSNVKLDEAHYARQPIYTYDKNASGASAYNQFVTELTGEKEHGKITITRRKVQGKGTGAGKSKGGTRSSKQKTGQTKKR